MIAAGGLMVKPAGFESDGELYKLAMAGSRDAVESLVQRHHPDLMLYLKAKTTAHAVAEDAVADTWLRFFRHLKQAKEDPTRALSKPESVRFWLYRTALNRMRDNFRSSGRRTALSERATFDAKALGLTSYEPEDVDRLEGEERRSALRTAFASLGEKCREILSLMSADPPLSYKEISELTGRPVGSLGPTRQRCLAELRRLMLGVEAS